MSFLRTDEPRGPMSLLEAAESRLGPLTTWPSNILNNLFFEPVTFKMLFRLVNFFYGNRVSCSLVIQLIDECKDDLIVTGIISALYEGYDRFSNGVHMGVYFDVRYEKILFINGKNNNQLEIVESANHNISRGFRGRSDNEIAALRDRLANTPYCN